MISFSKELAKTPNGLLQVLFCESISGVPLPSHGQTPYILSKLIVFHNSNKNEIATITIKFDLSEEWDDSISYQVVTNVFNVDKVESFYQMIVHIMSGSSSSTKGIRNVVNSTVK